MLTALMIYARDLPGRQAPLRLCGPATSEEVGVRPRITT